MSERVLEELYVEAPRRFLPGLWNEPYCDAHFDRSYIKAEALKVRFQNAQLPSMGLSRLAERLENEREQDIRDHEKIYEHIRIALAAPPL